MVTNPPKSVTESVNDIVIVELRARGISHSSAAKALGIGRDTFARRLSGPQGFTAAELERVATLIGLAPSELLSRAERQSAAGQGAAA